jgi:hypothetical protein
MWYNIWCRHSDDTIIVMGLTLSSTFVHYQLDQQVACQRYRQTSIDAKSTETRGDLINRLADVFSGNAAKSAFAFAA